jgi:hypothetical protein
MAENFAAKFLTSDTNGIPNWAWGLIIIGGLGVGVYVKNKFSSSTPAAPGSTYTPTGPIDTGGSNPPTPTGPPTPAPGPATYPRQAQVRAQGAVPTFDYNNSGAPVHLLPDNTTPYVYEAPWNSSITLNSQVSGGLNGGTTVWYSVAGGYISSFDIVGG